ncbi:MAG: hypothetical protein ACI9EZ_000701 [Halobacteriales archaeon]|jgi:hypothetical protein
MNAEDTVVDFNEALRRDEPSKACFPEHPETCKAGIIADYEGYDAMGKRGREPSRVTGTRTDDGKGVEQDTCVSGVLEPVGDDGEWVFVQLHGSGSQGR